MDFNEEPVEYYTRFGHTHKWRCVKHIAMRDIYVWCDRYQYRHRPNYYSLEELLTNVLKQQKYTTGYPVEMENNHE
jgi:hypothetical protein